MCLDVFLCLYTFLSYFTDWFFWLFQRNHLLSFFYRLNVTSSNILCNNIYVCLHLESFKAHASLDIPWLSYKLDMIDFKLIWYANLKLFYHSFTNYFRTDEYMRYESLGINMGLHIWVSTNVFEKKSALTSFKISVHYKRPS